MTMAKKMDSVNSPADLRTLSIQELSGMAEEIRALILETVSRNGGHLGSNLGVVELTLALHYVFDSPRDKIIWDVGHQCYTHKILTGRRERFAELRRSGGILGFPCRDESEHDAYNTGHASTALSAALGMAVGRDKNKGDFHVIAVIGDGSLTGGVALEALNQIGHLRERLIIVLNYNEMSISPNVGAWSKYLSYLVSGQHFIRLKDQAKSFLKAIPVVGWPMIQAGHALEELIKKTIFPGLVFEELGIKYIGPVEGHSLRSLIEAFELAKKYDGPILIQCVTQKGRGYQPARTDPEKFHGAGPFEIATGNAEEQRSRTSALVLYGLRRDHGQDRPEGPEDPVHHGGDGRGDGPRPVRREVPGPVLRRGDRRTACRHLRRGAGHLRVQAGRGHLFDLPSEGLRPGLS